jgi:hypothetical protein
MSGLVQFARMEEVFAAPAPEHHHELAGEGSASKGAAEQGEGGWPAE